MIYDSEDDMMSIMSLQGREAHLGSVSGRNLSSEGVELCFSVSREIRISFLDIL